MERFNPNSNTWTFVTPMPDIRMSFSACVLDGKIFVIGGFDGFSSYRTVWMYHHAINKWHSLSIQLPSHITASDAAVIDNLPNAIDYTYYGRCIFDVNNGDDNVQQNVFTDANYLAMKRNYCHYLLFKFIPNPVLLKCKYFYVQNQNYFINYLFSMAKRFSKQQKQYLHQLEKQPSEQNHSQIAVMAKKDRKELIKKQKCKPIPNLNFNRIINRTKSRKKKPKTILNQSKLAPEMEILKLCSKCQWPFKESGT